MNPENDAALIAVLMERLDKQRLPRLLALKDRVDAGETLSEIDLTFLGEALSDARHTQALAERHPEFLQLRARIIHLYNEITARALENEQRSY